MNVSDQIKSLGTILSVGAHPDDETFTAGGLLAAAVANGQTVACVTATKGEEGVQDENRWPAAQLGDIRAEELKTALSILGISHHHWLGYRDGACQAVADNDAVSVIAQLMKTYQPDTIVTFGPDGMTGHSDHIQVSKWVTRAAAEYAKPITILHVVNTKDHYKHYLKKIDETLNIFFNVEKPKLVAPVDCEIDLHLPQNIRQLKCQALKAMPSQTAKMFELFDDDFLSSAFGRESFITP